MPKPENASSENADRSALIVGGGVVGMATALSLQRTGWTVTLVEAEPTPRTASWGNAGHIATEQAEPIASPAMIRGFAGRLFWRGGALSLPPREIATWLPFSLRLLRAARADRYARAHAALADLLAQAMPAWTRHVAALGAPELLRQDGHVVLWETPESAARGLANWQAADTGTARFRPLTEGERDDWRSLIHAPIAGGIRFSGSGQIADPTHLAQTTTARFLADGGTRIVARVAAVGDGEVRLDDNRRLSAAQVVVTAGIASAALLRPFGLKAPIIAERGYHLQTGPQVDWPADLPPVVFEDRSMIVTRFAGGLRAASIVEFARAEAAPDPAKWNRLRHHIAALGLPIGDDAQPWMGARPTLPDYLPAIGRVPGARGLSYAFGHNHLGLTLAPITGELVAAMLGDIAPPVFLEAFNLARFG
ncbi:FAD-binding oxidoreductase [Sphingomonadaceae bacterium jetA1]|jgi:D-amino-acid dehydrogenase|uniref:NAD(P)/FAD-dependent oxidoreductase n=1 Tax=Facivitalis istanbulensis TaxID=3075838 RepID=UPI00347D01EB